MIRRALLTFSLAGAVLFLLAHPIGWFARPHWSWVGKNNHISLYVRGDQAGIHAVANQRQYDRFARYQETGSGITLFGSLNIYSQTKTSWNRVDLTLHYWWLLILFSIYPLIVMVWRPHKRRTRRRLGLCIECGYSLHGNTSGVCPECGTAIVLANE